MVNLAFDDDMQSGIEKFKKFADKTDSKVEITINSINARDIHNLNQANRNIKQDNDKNDVEQTENEKTITEKTSELPAEDFLLALTVTLFNYGEHQFVSNIYDYILREKYKSIFNSEITKEPEKSQSEKDTNEKPESSQRLARRSSRALDVFGKGFEQRLKGIGAQYDEQMMSINGAQQRIKIVRFSSQRHLEVMWDLWRNEYPRFLSEIKPELLFLAQFGNFDVRILATRALGEIACTSISAAVSEYLNGFAKSRDLQVRYNVGFTLSAIIANDERNLADIFDLLEKWLQRDWRSRWTVAAAISRLYKYDVEKSTTILTQVTELSESLSRDTEVEEPYLELNPLTMVWHSASFMFLDGCVIEVLEMLHEWFSSKQRHKQALPDIARELFLDIMQSYFDIRASSLVNNPKNKRETLTETTPSKDIKNIDPVGLPPNNLGQENDISNEAQDSKSLESPNTDTKANNATPELSTESANPGISSNAQKNAGEIEKERDLVEDKSVSDVVNRIDINSANKVLWGELSKEFKDKKNGAGKFTKIIVDLTLESLRRGWSNSQSNLWFYPDRKPPYQRMQAIIHTWLELSTEDEFDYVQDPLYIILLECYVNLSREIRDVKLKNKLAIWYSDKNEKVLHQNKLIREVLDAMDHVSSQIITK